MRSGAHNQERILEPSLVQNGGLLKHGDRARGQKELLPRAVRDGRLSTPRLGEGEGKGSFNGVFICSRRCARCQETSVAKPLTSR